MTTVAASNAPSDLALASLAVLNVNWHANALSYLDSFVPFVVEAVRKSGDWQVSEQGACAAVAGAFGLVIPATVMSSILRRAVKDELAARVNGGEVLFAEKAMSEGGKLQAELADLLREQADLEGALADFVRERFGLTWSPADASKSLLAYIEDASARMIVSNYGGATPDETFESEEHQRVAVAAFIAEISSNQPTRFEYLMNVAKGSFLATTMFFQNHFDRDRKFKNTTLYLDTGVILGALGYEGAERQSAALEWIKLALAQGARLAAFDRTTSEAKGVLQNAVELVKAGRAWEGRPGNVASYFYEQGMSPGVAAAEASAFDSRMSRLRIEMHGLPDADAKRHLQIDEDEVEAVLNEGPHPYQNTNALHHDSRILSAIVMLRNRSAQDRFEEARAIFVTGNFRVIRAARQIGDFKREPWPVAMHVNDVAVLLWIKTGVETSDLPSKQLLATCLTILRPSEATWARYVAEIEQLRSRGVADDADVALIVQQTERDRSSLVDSIDSHGTLHLRPVSQLLDEAKAAIATPIQETADRRSAELEANLATAQTEALLAQGELDVIKTQRRASLRRTSNVIATALLLLVIGAVTFLIWLLGHLFGRDLAYAATVVGFLVQLVIVSIPVSKKSLWERIRDRLLRRREVHEHLEAPAPR